MGRQSYTTDIDMWSIGCVMAELFHQSPLFPGECERDQVELIVNLFGTSLEDYWPEFRNLPNYEFFNPSTSQFSKDHAREKLPLLSEAAYDLIVQLLQLRPENRISAENALKHPFCEELQVEKEQLETAGWCAAMFTLTSDPEDGEEGRARLVNL